MILLEFNELSPSLMETFIEQGYLPNFKRLRDQSQAFPLASLGNLHPRNGLNLRLPPFAVNQHPAGFAPGTARR